MTTAAGGLKVPMTSVIPLLTLLAGTLPTQSDMMWTVGKVLLLVVVGGYLLHQAAPSQQAAMAPTHHNVGGPAPARFTWGRIMLAVAVVAIAYSLTSELALMAGSRGDLAAKRASVVEQNDARRARVQSARSELAALAPSRAIADIQADVTALLAGNP